MKDIENQEDIKRLMTLFYDQLLADAQISYLFTDVVKMNWSEHLPILVTFWSQILFGTGGYTNNLTQIHLDIHQKEALTPALFQIWLQHFQKVLRNNFSGTNTEVASKQAEQLAVILQIKIKNKSE